ncbi:hypothetical protein [Pseudomonas oryziphila]|uniref:Uncharacterized protein n=1 Tax=Pseudomonas entomophila TaxID=312306 RepID=A0A3S8UKA6_9PSED|nr:hypothetical protein [Pseudomonas oryziphila]AZL68667.1 hypothetical protein EJA05_13410 [Pseudomonas oryziphila]
MVIVGVFPLVPVKGFGGRQRFDLRQLTIEQDYLVAITVVVRKLDILAAQRGGGNLKLEREILKKAAVFFAKESR